MADSNQHPNFIDRVGKMAVFGLFGLLVVIVISYPIIFSMSKTGVISNEKIPKIAVEDAPDILHEIIKSQQIDNVKESLGVEDFQCFTSSDFENFLSSNTLQKILKETKSNPLFLGVINASSEMSAEEFYSLVDNARKVRRPTWTELGKVSAKGQTDAGHKAELMISNGVADLILEMKE